MLANTWQNLVFSFFCKTAMPVGHYLVRGDAYVYFKFHSYKTFGEIKLFVTE